MKTLLLVLSIMTVSAGAWANAPASSAKSYNNNTLAATNAVPEGYKSLPCGMVVSCNLTDPECGRGTKEDLALLNTRKVLK